MSVFRIVVFVWYGEVLFCFSHPLFFFSFPVITCLRCLFGAMIIPLLVFAGCAILSSLLGHRILAYGSSDKIYQSLTLTYMIHRASKLEL